MVEYSSIPRSNKNTLVNEALLAVTSVSIRENIVGTSLQMPIQSARPGLSFVPRDIVSVMRTIHNAGFDVWVVGGALRDFLLGSNRRTGPCLERNHKGNNIRFPEGHPVGIRHGTVQVHTRTRDIEVTSFELREKREY